MTPILILPNPPYSNQYVLLIKMKVNMYYNLYSLIKTLPIINHNFFIIKLSATRNDWCKECGDNFEFEVKLHSILDSLVCE